MRSIALQDVDLKNGIKIPKDTAVIVSAHSMRDPSLHTDPNVFNGYRFLNPENNPESRHFTSVSVDHMGFGFGKHACPGRYFTHLEAKILIAHLLLKYDFKFAPGYQHEIRRSGFDQVVDPSAKLVVRRRAEELNIQALYR